MVGHADTVSTADYDRDGFIDLLVTNGRGAEPFANGPTQLFRNQGNDNHWLEIDLEGNVSNRDGIGTYLLLTSNEISQYRLHGGGMHRFTQDSTRIHFGLANNEIADSLVIHWPSGTMQTLLNVPADQIIHIVESEDTTDFAVTPPPEQPEPQLKLTTPYLMTQAVSAGAALSPFTRLPCLPFYQSLAQKNTHFYLKKTPNELLRYNNF